jgi:hypothetical protein
MRAFMFGSVSCLKAAGVGNPTPSAVLEIVADQDDWKKRLRELRYPVVGWEIHTNRYKGPSGKIQIDYVLDSYEPWGEDPTGAIRRFEQEREHRNKAERDSELD